MGGVAMQGEKGHADVVTNVWKSNPWPLKVAKVAYRCAWLRVRLVKVMAAGHAGMVLSSFVNTPLTHNNF
jgi:hypothetical protein